MTTPHNLPAELTSFVGREAQLAELRRLLHRSRLITLTGPGGAGKTRLALRLAAQSLDRFPNGVWYIDLAPIGDGRLLEQTVAAVCGIKEGSERSLAELLKDRLAAERTLIAFDGCEHLVDACADLTSQLLRASPKLTIVATSREPLGVAGEVTWRTPSLTVPRLADSGHPELLLESEAVRLYVDRAKLSRPDFELTHSAAGPLAQICTRLEGIPLAIELAAGLSAVMTLEEVLDRLSHRFRLLTGGSRGTLQRHQTLRQAVDWSYGLLSPTEQALFTRLGVFAGGFDLASVEAVVNGEPIAADDVLSLLSRLVNKSLVVAESTRLPTTRYRMLDTIREYALEKLQLVGEAFWRRRHAGYFTEWAARATQHLDSQDQGYWLRRIDEEQANIRLALEWNLAEQSDSALRLAVSMSSFWWMRRSLAEGLDWLGRALQQETSERQLRTVALVSRSQLHRRRGDYVAAGREAREAVAMARSLGLKKELARALTMVGIVTSTAGDITASTPYFREALELAKEVGDQQRIVSSLNNIAFVLSSLGNQEDASRHVEQALAVTLQTGNLFQRANVLDTYARIQFRLGNKETALRSWREALAISADFGDAMNIADCLEGIALIAMANEDASRAVTLVSAAEAVRSSTGGERTTEWAGEVIEGFARSKARLGRAAADAALRLGSRMNIEEAVRFAAGESPTGHRDGHLRLTDREIQVARLIAHGLTNGEVANRLRISDRTVDAHVEHIRNKLGLRTRSQIAVWAHERLGTA